MTDSAASYDAAIAALRMRAVMEGAPPREREPVDIILMTALSGRPRA